jgi:L-serine dehydratase
MGPMRAACRFARELESNGELEKVGRVQVNLYGSLALTGMGHGTDRAVLLGLSGNEPATIDPGVIAATVAEIRATKTLKLAGMRSIGFDEPRDLLFERETMFPPEARTRHPNGLRLTAFDGSGNRIEERTYFSIGGGFIVEDGADAALASESEAHLPYPFHSAAELLEVAHAHGLTIDRVMMANECARLRIHDPSATEEALAVRVRAGIDAIWETMKGCIERGISTEGILPGGLNVRRRAHRLAERLKEREASGQPSDPLAPLDWVTVYAMAVNEENAAGGRVVTAPTNGAAGVVPAVARFYERFVTGADHEGIMRFFLTSAAIGILYKENA